MYYFHVRFKNSDRPIDIVTNYDGVFPLAWALNFSNFCIEFTVTDHTYKTFGWSKMDKWKERLFDN